MEEIIHMTLPSGVKMPTEEDIRKGKKYILQREQAATAISGLVDELMKNAAEKITKLCYQFNVDPKEFRISSAYNEKLFDLIAQILDNLEDEILELVEEYALKCTEDKERQSALLAWIVLLGRDNKNLRQTLEKRLFMFSRDIEAMIAAMRMTKLSAAQAITKIRSGIKAVYVIPEVMAAFKKASTIKATYIRSKGVKYGNVGSSNSEAVNIDRFVRTTIQMAWMRNQLMDFKESGAVGYYQLRGSSYLCDICDDETGFHANIDEMMSKPYPHPNCQCFRIPIYREET